MSLISRLEGKRIAGAVQVLTTMALFAGFGGSNLDDLIALAMRAQHGNENHDSLLVKRIISWHTSGQKSTSATSPDSLPSGAAAGERADGARGKSRWNADIVHRFIIMIYVKIIRSFLIQETIYFISTSSLVFCLAVGRFGWGYERSGLYASDPELTQWAEEKKCRRVIRT